MAISEIDEQIGTSNPSYEQLQAQASRYRQIASACAKSPNCVRFTVWGLTDPSSWINTIMHKDDAPLLFDGNYQPKPAYWAVREALTGQQPTQPAQPQPEQPSQPAQPTPSTPIIIGSEDDMRNNTLRGWACDTNNPSATITVALFTENGTEIGQTEGNQNGEAGIGELCSGYANHRFTFPLPESLMDGKVHTIYAKARLSDGSLIPLTFNPSQTIQVGQENPPVSNPTPSGDDVVGYHDDTQGYTMFGWACDPDDFNASLRIDFYADGNGFGTFLGSAYATELRESAVGNYCGGNSAHGFTFYLPASLEDGQPHTIYAYGINIGSGAPYKLLGNSPKFYQSDASTTPATPLPTNGNVLIDFVSRDCADGLIRFTF